jgi:hypothetical protein
LVKRSKVVALLRRYAVVGSVTIIRTMTFRTGVNPLLPVATEKKSIEKKFVLEPTIGCTGLLLNRESIRELKTISAVIKIKNSVR